MNSFGIFTAPMVKELMYHSISNHHLFDATFTEKAIKSLVKRLRQSKEVGCIEKLRAAITSKSKNTECVKIPRSLDGRMQVQHRKTLPHLLYCQIWRWPDIRSQHELKQTDTCKFTYRAKCDQICVNPYHYERVEEMQIPPVLVPRYPAATVAHFEALHQRQQGQFCQDDFIIPNNLNFNDICTQYPPQVRSPGGYLSEDGDGSIISSPIGSNACPSPQGQPPVDGGPAWGANGVINQEHGATTAGTASLTPQFDPNFPASASELAAQTSLMQLHEENKQKERSAINQIESQLTDSFGVNRTKVPFPEPSHWCVVNYYELNTRLGVPFEATSSVLNIDGYTSPNTNDRLCLGGISNPNREQATVMCRQHIGKGIELIYSNGQVSIVNISDSSVFIQSPNMSELYGASETSVVKIIAGSEAVVFNNQNFARKLSDSVNHGFEAVYGLTRMCTVRLSFVKGWGSDYRRQHITSVPSWIEIHLNGPLQWLDRVLQQMGSPSTKCTSMS